MRPLRSFEEYLNNGIIKRRTPDIARARSLFSEAQKRKIFLNEMLNKIGISDVNANYFIENCYDILIELIRAKLLIKGFSSSGKGAHEAEVTYMRKIGFPEKDVRFMNDLRFFRNSILYYGRDYNAEYGQKVITFLNKLYPKLYKKI